MLTVFLCITFWLQREDCWCSLRPQLDGSLWEPCPPCHFWITLLVSLFYCQRYIAKNNTREKAILLCRTLDFVYWLSLLKELFPIYSTSSPNILHYSKNVWPKEFLLEWYCHFTGTMFHQMMYFGERLFGQPIFCQTTEYSFVRKLQRKQKKTQKKTETFFSKRLIAIRAFEVSYILQNLSSLHTCTTLKTMSWKNKNSQNKCTGAVSVEKQKNQLSPTLILLLLGTNFHLGE